jgi:hypothetical protein
VRLCAFSALDFRHVRMLMIKVDDRKEKYHLILFGVIINSNFHSIFLFS